jgi:oxygen-dependent protoporphyrinogen oxidase
MRDVIIVGAGVAGLAAAWALRDRDILVLEGDGRIGGRIRSEPRGEYWMNLGAHVFGGAGTATGRLMTETGITSKPVPGVLNAVSMEGRLVAGGSIATYPFRLPLSLADRVAAIRSGIKLRRAVAAYDLVSQPRAGEPEHARRDRMLAFLGDETFSTFIGKLPPGAEALYRPTITRSTAEPEEIAAGHGVGYFHLVWRKGEGLSRNVPGGPSLFIAALARPLGDRLVINAPVREVVQHPDRVVVRFERAGQEEEVEARGAVIATPAFVTAAIVKALPADTLAALESIPYGPYVVVAFLTAERAATRWDSLYAIATPGRPFNMIFNVANVTRGPGARRPGGSLMLYAGGRRLATRLVGLSDDEIVAQYLDGLDAVFPEARAMVVESLVRRLPKALPYPYPGRYRIQSALDRPLGRIALAGDYLGNMYSETAIQTGLAAAAHVAVHADVSAAPL